MRHSRATSLLAAVLATSALIVSTGVSSAFATAASAAAPLALTSAGCVESFDGMSNGSSAASLPPGIAFDEQGTSANNNGLYGSTDGSSNAGDVYSLGAVGSTDRALGELRSGTLIPTLGVVVRNDTGATMTSLTVSYALEQWRQGGTNRFDGFTFSYSTSTTALTGGTYTNLATLDSSAPNGGATGNVALNGNLAGNRTIVTATISGLTIAPSGTILLRWTDTDAAGADDAIGIDDLAAAANGAATPTAACSTGGGSGPTTTLIHTIQGAAASSPMAGQSATISGIVVGRDDQVGSSFGTGNAINLFPTDRGFFVEEENADWDADPATSEGMYVGLSSSATPLPAIGDQVVLTGTVRDGQSAPAFGQSRIETTSYTTGSSANTLPTAITIDASIAHAQTVGVETNPTRSYYETFEGMRVVLASGVAQSGGTNKFGELFLVPGTTIDTLLRTDPVEPGLIGTAADAGAGNPANPYDPPAPSGTAVQADQHDTVTNLAGPLAYSFGNYKVMVQVGQLPTVQHTGVAYPYDRLSAPLAGQVRLASFNLENFFPTGGALDGHIVGQAQFEEKRNRSADAIGRLLQAPDVIAVMEIGDNQHLGQSGATSSLDTLQSVATRLGTLGYGSYTAYALEGNDRRGIDVGFLVKSTITVLSGPTQMGGLTTPGTCADVAGRLFDRPPLFLQVDLGTAGGPTWLVSNHFASKSAPDSCRLAQATWVRDQVATIETGGGQVIVMGDLNAFENEGALTTLEGNQTSLDNLWDTVPAGEAYSFQFNGLLQTLDHVLITSTLTDHVAGFEYAHVDNDYFDRASQTDGHKVSDHDPPVLTLSAGAPPVDVPEAPQPWMFVGFGGVVLALLVARQRRHAA